MEDLRCYLKTKLFKILKTNFQCVNVNIITFCFYFMLFFNKLLITKPEIQYGIMNSDTMPASRYDSLHSSLLSRYRL